MEHDVTVTLPIERFRKLEAAEQTYIEKYESMTKEKDKLIEQLQKAREEQTLYIRVDQRDFCYYQQRV